MVFDQLTPRLVRAFGRQAPCFLQQAEPRLHIIAAFAAADTHVAREFAHAGPARRLLALLDAVLTFEDGMRLRCPEIARRGEGCQPEGQGESY